MGQSSEKNEEGRRRVAANVRRLRHEAALSQEALAHVAGVDRSHLARFEAQHINVSLDVLLSLAQALEVDVAELFRQDAQS